MQTCVHALSHTHHVLLRVSSRSVNRRPRNAGHLCHHMHLCSPPTPGTTPTHAVDRAALPPAVLPVGVRIGREELHEVRAAGEPDRPVGHLRRGGPPSEPAKGGCRKANLRLIIVATGEERGWKSDWESAGIGIALSLVRVPRLELEVSCCHRLGKRSSVCRSLICTYSYAYAHIHACCVCGI